MKRTIYQLPFDLIPMKLPAEGGAPVDGAVLRFVDEPGQHLHDFPMDAASLDELIDALQKVRGRNPNGFQVVSSMPDILRPEGNGTP